MLQLFGMLRFASRSDADAYCERNKIAPCDRGLKGDIATGFKGLNCFLPVSEGYRAHIAKGVVSSDELWIAICRRRAQLDVDAGRTSTSGTTSPSATGTAKSAKSPGPDPAVLVSQGGTRNRKVTDPESCRELGNKDGLPGSLGIHARLR